MSVREPGNGFRDWLGGVLSRAADWLLYGDGHVLILRDGDLNDIVTIHFTGSYSCQLPHRPYTLACCDDELF